MPQTIRILRGIGPPATLTDSVPAFDQTPARPRLFLGLSGVPVLIADPVYVASLEARIVVLEAALRDLQLHTWADAPPPLIIP